MPLYEYICRKCSGRFEAIRRMSERTLPVTCPRCGSTDTELAVSTAAFLGSGQGSACSTGTWAGGG